MLPEAGASYLRAMALGQRGGALDVKREESGSVERNGEWDDLLLDIRGSREYFSPRMGKVEPPELPRRQRGAVPPPPVLQDVVATCDSLNVRWALNEDKPAEKPMRTAENSPFNPAKLAMLLSIARGSDDASGRAPGSLSERGTAATGGEAPLGWGAVLASRAIEAAKPLPVTGFTLQVSIYQVQFDATTTTFTERYAPFKLGARPEAVERAVTLRGLRPHWHYRLRLSASNGAGDSP